MNRWLAFLVKWVREGCSGPRIAVSIRLEECAVRLRMVVALRSKCVSVA